VRPSWSRTWGPAQIDYWTVECLSLGTDRLSPDGVTTIRLASERKDLALLAVLAARQDEQARVLARSARRHAEHRVLRNGARTVVFP
jgi:hypothetical protein